MTNSQRFIDAYNAVDKALHTRFGLKPSMSFTDCVRRAAAVNAVIRKFEDELLDYARLRNAIVHKSNSAMTIAEPHDDVTERFEHIKELVVTPPSVSSVCHRAETIRADAPLIDAVRLMTGRGYSNLPVVDGNAIVGLLTNKCITRFVAAHLDGVDAALRGAKAKDALDKNAEYYDIMSDVPVDDILAAFEKNRKLSMIIITKNGRPDSEILGLVTVSDLVIVTKMLDAY